MIDDFVLCFEFMLMFVYFCKDPKSQRTTDTKATRHRNRVAKSDNLTLHELTLLLTVALT